MLFTPWLQSVRTRRLRPQTKSHRRPKADRRLLAEFLEQRTLLAAPQFVSVSPNVGEFLQDGDVRSEVPREFEFQFSPGETIAAGTVSAIQILGAGHDGGFTPAGVISDFGTNGGVTLRVGARRLGVGDNGKTLTIATADNAGNGPTVTTDASGNLTLTLDTNITTPTTAQRLLDFATNSANAKQILTVEILAGNPSLTLANATPGTSPLRGASAAYALNSFGATGFNIAFEANQPGSGGNDIQIQVNRLDLGSASAQPRINVIGKRIELTLNENSTAPTTGSILVNAINTHSQTSNLINARIVSGVPSTSLQTATDGTLITLNHSDRLLTASVASGFQTTPAVGTPPFLMQFVALQQGIDGNEISLLINQANLGSSSATPTVSVSGKRITITLNSNSVAPTTAADLLTALASSALIQASIVSGSPATVLSTIANGTILQLGGADTAVNPGFRGLLPAQAPDTQRRVIYRFAAPLDDDLYRVQVIGTGTSPLLDIENERVNDGVDSFLDVGLDLGATVNAIVPQPMIRQQLLTINSAANITDGDTITIQPGSGSSTITFEFNNTSGTPTAPRSGNISIDYDSTTVTAASLASAIATAINTATFSTPDVAATASGSQLTIEGGAFAARVKLSLANTTAISQREGQLVQRRNLVNVYFNHDSLDPTLAQDPRFYRLVNTNGTLVTNDDVELVPSAVIYDNATHSAVLDFGSNLPTNTYKLLVGDSEESNDTLARAVNVGTVFDTTPYQHLGYIGDAGGSSDVDLYRVSIPDISTINVSVTPGATLNTSIRLLDENGVGIDLSNNGGVGADDTLGFTTLTGGTFYVEVSSTASTTGSYQLNISTSAAFSTSDDNSSFADATQLGFLGEGGQLFSSQIEPQSIALPPPAGGSDEPGHREIPHESHGAGSGTTASTPSSLGTVTFYFPSAYGVDSQGNVLQNQITEDQKMRAREIFEMYGAKFGFEAQETTTGGLAIVTGDPRAVDPTIPPDAVGGIAGGGIALMNARLNFTAQDNQFGGGWMAIALHEIGHAIGLGHSYDIRSDQGNGVSGEDAFNGNNDTVHGLRISPNTGTDIDLYQFEVEATGKFSAEIVAERLASSSLLNSALKLYRKVHAHAESDYVPVGQTGVEIQFRTRVAGPAGNATTVTLLGADLGAGALPTLTTDASGIVVVTLNTRSGSETTAQQLVDLLNLDSTQVSARILSGDGSTSLAQFADGAPTTLLGGAEPVIFAQNDDYFSNDSYISLTLDPDTYFIGVSSTGNIDYDPTIPDTGFNGTTDGNYTLRIHLDTAENSSLFDTTKKHFDGNNDGVAGGPSHEFAFQSANTLVVDKTVVANSQTSLNSTATTVRLTTLTPFPTTPGFQIRIDSEEMTVTAIDTVNRSLTVQRARNGTTAASHAFNAPVTRVVATTTTAVVAVGATTIPVANAAAFISQTPFVATIGSDRVTVTAVNTGSNTLTVNPTPNGYASGAVIRELGGTVQNPFGLLKSAISASVSGDAIRVVGNGGTDNDVLTPSDARPYLLGFADTGSQLEDGSKLELPQNVVLQVDAGAVVKLQAANLDAGTSAVGLSRSGGAMQILGNTRENVYFTSYENDLLGGDSDGVTDGANAGDWGGLVFREDSDFRANTTGATSFDPGIFLNYVNHAAITYGGGLVTVNSVTKTYTSIHMATSRPTIAFNTISNGADAAISADPDSFDDSRGRIGPDLHNNVIFDNTTNGVFVRIETQLGQPVQRLTKTARFDDTDITHVITQNLEIVGNPGGPLDGAPRPSGRLAVDPGVVVKLGASRIEGMRGNSALIAEGTAIDPVIFTSIQDDRFGSGGTYDVTGNLGLTNPAAGDWGGLAFNANSRLSLDQAYVAYGGGSTPIEGSTDRFNAVEIHHAVKARIANTEFDTNAGGAGGSRNGRGGTSSSTIFVRQAQPILVNNVFRNNTGSIIDINANAMRSEYQRDTGRSTGEVQDFSQFSGNHGPLVRLNKVSGNSVNGMNIRPDALTTESVWDDTDVVHVLTGEILVDQHHTYSGIRLQSNPGESLVVKLAGANAGFTADGIYLDIDDRIGGTVQVIGQPGFPVVLTSLADDTIGASFDPAGFPQTDTNNNGPSTGVAGAWRSLLFTQRSNDRNVRTIVEAEHPNNGGIETNDNTFTKAEFLGELAPQHITGPTATDYNADDTSFRSDSDDNRPAGFEVKGFISGDDPGDVDIYSFKATAGNEVWIDLDRTRGNSLDPVVEVILADGTLVARARYNATTGVVDLSGSAQGLEKDTYNGGDYYTFGFRDTGFRLTLPGTAGQVGTYFVRVRSNQTNAADLDDDNLLKAGLTRGEYQLQIRERQKDEKPGSVVRYADIRFATNGIDIAGLPAHSPIVGENTETTAANGPANAPQVLGNLLESDLNVISVGGDLSAADDFDFFRYNSDYAATVLGDSIQVIGGSSGGGKTWTTVFDLDYADGLTRGDTTMIIFDATGRPILIGRESNIEDDRPASGNANDLDDLTRGSIGALDPYIGPVQMPTGNPGDTTNYDIEVLSNAQLNRQLNQFYNGTATNPLTRLEPINSTTRIVEDHVGYQGYTSNGNAVDPTTTAGLFDLSDSLQLSAHVRPFDFGDVVLFVNQGDSLRTVNPLFGEVTTQVNNDLTAGSDTMQDIVMRSDGVLYGYQRVNATAGTAGRLVSIDTGNGTLTTVGTDNIPGEAAPYVDGITSDMDDLTITNEVGAVTFRRTGGTGGPTYEGFYAVFENEGGGTGTDTTRNTKLYRFDPASGAVANSANDNGFGNIQYSGVTYATTTIGVFNSAPSATTITLQARAPGSAGNGIVVNVNRSLGTGTQSVAAAGRTITVNTGTGTTAQGIVDAINSHPVAGLLVQAARTTNNNVTGDVTVTSGGATGGGVEGAAGVIKGNVTGLAFDQFSGGNLYGVTNRGEFIRIDQTSQNIMTATLIADFTSSGIGTVATTNGFQGLALGPQNVDANGDGTPGDFATTFFAVTDDGRLVAFDNAGTPVSAFDSNRQTQTLSVLGEQETLTGNVTVQATTLTVSDASVFTSPTPFDIQVGTERMTVTAVDTATDTLTVTRGADATFVSTVGAVNPVATGDISITVANGALFATATPFMIRIDNELLRVTNVAGNVLSVARAQGGTTASAHNAGSAIYETSAVTHTAGERVFDLSSKYTLTFDETTGAGLLTTAPLSVNAPGAVSTDETQELDIVAYSGTWGIEIVNNFAHTTALAQDIADLNEGDTDTIFVQSTASFPTVTPFIIRVENELMQVTNVGASSFDVIRGVRNTTAVAHQGDTTTGGLLAPQTVFEVLTTTLDEGGTLPAASSQTLALGMTTATTTVDTVGVLAGVVDGVSLLLIDGEQMLVTAGAGTNSLTVSRLGQNGTTVAGHGAGSVVTLMNDTIDVLDTDGMTLANTPFIRIDNEVMRVLAIGATSIDVLRASNGTATAAHNDGSTVNRVITATLSATSRTAAQVETAILTALTNAGITATAADIVTNLGTTGVVPAGSPATPVSVQFIGNLGSHDWQSLRIDTSNLVGNDIDQVSLGVSFIGGTFQLQFVTTTMGTLTTTAGALDFDATPAELMAELDNTLGVGNYVLSNYSTVGALSAINTFDIQFTGRLQDQAVVTSVLNATSLQNREINTLRRQGAAPTSGTFELQITAAGVTTVNVNGANAINFNDSGATIETKIENAIAGAGVIGTVTVSPAGGQFDTGTTYTITFEGAYDNRNVTLSFLNSTLNNGATPLINTTINGDSNGSTSSVQAGTGVFGNVFTTTDGNLSVLDALQALPTTLLNGATDLQVTGGDLPLTDVSITFLDPSFTAINQPSQLLVNNSQMRNTDGLDAGTPTFGEAESFVQITGAPGDGLPDSFLIQVTGLNGSTGLAFSPLDFNLWHPTTRRGAVDEPGHGINTAYDNSRTPSAESRDVTDGLGTTRTQSEAQGGHSFYFGLEEYSGGAVTPYLNYEASNTQLGILNNIFQSDLTSSAVIGNNFNLPGGALGTLVTNTFDLVSETGDESVLDRPTLYLNYFLATQGSADAVGGGTMRDSARVFISTDDGQSWELLATNNSPQGGATELPNFITHSQLANVSDDRQRIQELFDNSGSWRQTRVDMSDYVGLTGLRLRFDFSTAGTLITPGLSTNDTGLPAGQFSLDTPVDAYGDLTSPGRGQNNNHEGFYIDDIIIGWSERGEMITGAVSDKTNFQVPQAPTSLMLPQELLSGAYQVEVRRGFEYAANKDKMTPDIVVNNTFDSNIRFISGVSGAPEAQTVGDVYSTTVEDHFDLNDVDLTTFGFDPAVGWTPSSTGSNSPWFALPVAMGTATTLVGNISATANTMFVADASSFPSVGTPFILDIEGELVGAQVLNTLLGLVAIVRGPTAVAHTTGAEVSLTDPVATSGPVSSLQRSAMSVSQTTTGVSFRYRATADVGDVFRVYLDELGGEHGPIFQATSTTPGVNGADADGFITVNLTFDPGIHTLFFSYEKDGSDGTDLISDALEGVQIDDVVFAPISGIYVRGDRNVERQQGHFQIENNFIRDSANAGIRVTAGTRDPISNASPLGSPIKFNTQNAEQLAPSLTITNNVIAGFGGFGVFFQGDANAGGTATNPATMVPFGKIINNTIYGGAVATGTGVRVETNASPTLLNNLIANTSTAIFVDASSSSTIPSVDRRTVISRTFFQGNTTNINGAVTDASQIVSPGGTPLFVNPAIGNFYLSAGSPAIDRSLSSQPDRVNFVSLRQQAGIPNSDAVALSTDVFGQTRVDDPTQTPSGIGGEVFFDLGAIERADTTGGIANLVVPEDNSNDDLDPLATVVHIDAPQFFNQFVVKFTDEGIGIDDSTVTPTQFTLAQTTRFGTTTLVNNSDYVFAYNSNTNEAILTSVTLFPQDARFTLTVDNSTATGIKDFAGNPLVPNQTDGTVRFDILVTNGPNDPPINAVPSGAIIDENTALAPSFAVFSAATSNAISVDDPDAFISDNRVQVTLTATNGTVTLPQNYATLVTLNSGSPIGSTVVFTGTIANINTLLAGGLVTADQLVFTPTQDFNGTAILQVKTNDLGNFSKLPLVPKEDVDNIPITVRPINSAPDAVTPSSVSASEDTPYTFSGGVISASDLIDDATNASTVSVTVSVTNGTLTLSTTAGLTFAPIGPTNDGTADATLTFSGSVANVNASLNGLIYNPLLNFNGSDTLTLMVNDLGNIDWREPAPSTTSVHALTDTSTTNISVAAVNDAPINLYNGVSTFPASAISALERTTFTFDSLNVISVSDVDTAETIGLLQVTLTTVNGMFTDGTITLPSITGLSFSVGDGDNDTTMTFTGTISSINAALSALEFDPNSLFTTASAGRLARVTILTEDLGASGAGAPTLLSDTDFVELDVLQVNDPPSVTVNNTTETLNEDGSITFGTSNGNPITIAESPLDSAPASDFQFTITATNGTVSLATAAIAGLNFSFTDSDGTGQGDGTSDAQMVFRGTIAEINLALDGLIYTPVGNYNGVANITLEVNDLGQTGAGGSKTASANIDLVVRAINDAPAITAPLTSNALEDTSLGGANVLTFSASNGNSITVGDPIDGPNSGTYSVTLAITTGTGAPGVLRVGPSVGAAIVTGNDSSLVTITGLLTDINSALNGLQFAPPSGEGIPNQTLTVTLHDNGNVDDVSPADLTDSEAITIVVDGDNDPPVITLPTPANQTLGEDANSVFGVASGRVISIADDDDNGQNLTLTLTVSSGIISLTNVGALASLSTNNTSTVIATGTESALNAALDGMIVDPSADFVGTLTLSVRVDDNGNTGRAPSPNQFDEESLQITYTAVNDAPTVTAQQSPLLVNEDSSVTLSGGNSNGVIINDVDLGAGQPRVTLTVTKGTLTLSRNTGLTFSKGDGLNDASMTFVGTSKTAINAALEGMQYQPNSGVNGTDTLRITVNDQGNTGAGPVGETTVDIPITIAAVNDAPTLAAPGSQLTDEDTPLVFSGATSIQVSDVDVMEGTGIVRLSLSANNGVLQLGSLANVTIVSGANASPNISFDAAINDANVALAGLSFVPSAEFSGTSTVSITVDDRGNLGSGGIKSASKTVSVTVASKNDAPTNIIPSSLITTNEDTALLLTGANQLSVTDVDSGSGTIQVALSATNGKLSVTPGLGVVVTGNDSSTLGLQGVLSNINSLLASLQFVPSLNFFGTATVTIATNDQGNSGGAVLTSLIDTDSFQISVSSVNDLPVGSADTYTVVRSGTLTAGDVDGSGDAIATNNGVLANDSDVDTSRTQWTAQLSSPPSHDAGAFVLNPNGTFNYIHNGDSATSDSFTYRISDGLGTNPIEVSVTININDAPVIATPTVPALDENRANGTVLVDIDASDANSNTISYSLVGGNVSGAFAINPATGVITVANSNALNFEINPTFTLTIQATDNAATPASSTLNVLVSLNDLSEVVTIGDSSWTDAGLTVKTDTLGTLLRVVTSGTNTNAFAEQHVLSKVSSLTINGRNTLSDRLVIDFGSGNPIPAGGVTYNGGTGGNDSLELINGLGFTTITHSFTSASSGTVTAIGASATSVIRYTGLEPIIDSLGADARVFSYGSGNDSITLNDGVSGDGRMSIAAPGTGESVDFLLPTTSLSISGTGGTDTITVASIDSLYGGTVSLFGGDGNDTLAGSSGVSGVTFPLYMDGGIGDDSISGGDGPDTLVGGSGKDVLTGFGGADKLRGGAGDDTLNGGDGVDELNGQGSSGDRIAAVISGTATLIGTSTSGVIQGTITNASVTDTIIDAEFVQITGSNGADSIDASGWLVGDLLIDALDGDDLVVGSPQRDDVTLGAGNDRITAGEGNDAVNGGSGNDTITGNAGNDNLIGGDGDDTIQGGAGNDTLTGGVGRDRLDGQGSSGDVVKEEFNDIVGVSVTYLPASSTADQRLSVTASSITVVDILVGIELAVIATGSGNDSINMTSWTQSATISGGAGDDIIKVGPGFNRVFAGSGNDKVLGNSGLDQIFGEDGNDSIDGGIGNDVVFGGNGNDIIRGGTGNDKIYGESGDDSLLGSAGTDLLLGGDGSDQVVGEADIDTVRGDGGSDTLAGGGNGVPRTGDTLTSDLSDVINEALNILFLDIV